jgi:hypothetical protein
VKQPTAQQLTDARNAKPAHHPATSEYRESWSVPNPYGTPIYYPSHDDALTAAQTGVY